jgi:hypothetical protein
MKKRLFQELDEINVSDIENKTQHLKISNHLIGAHKVKQGGEVIMGVDETVLYQITEQLLSGSQDKIVLLLIVDRKEYVKHEQLKA